MALADSREAPFSDCMQAKDLVDGSESVTLQTPETVLMLADCLGHPDPAIRDAFAYETFVAILRAGETSPQTLGLLAEKLVDNIRDADSDDAGFLASFSALVLAEVARVDRIEPYMTPGERSALARSGADYLQRIDDYRGFDPADGWRHGVAHAADLLMQLSLNPLLEARDARAILAAISSQVVPGNSHSYIFGESRRLARPVLYLAMTDLIPAEDWRSWFAALEATQDDPRWQNAYSSLEGLARIHNTENFAAAIVVRAVNSDRAPLQLIAEAAGSVLKSLP